MRPITRINNHFAQLWKTLNNKAQSGWRDGTRKTHMEILESVLSKEKVLHKGEILQLCEKRENKANRNKAEDLLAGKHQVQAVKRNNKLQFATAGR